ncbi:uncharacterized protein N7483_009772 [Penicillium malachiteum]|uniref:uncharacterized protein n=1 Tax=Penicillium malachiteum TaxID=1324776 RepID=UPI002548E137|nr:uncharacterized protein N7483_009772 [Penicillium malachiteum]KAJ5721838.1 hypothetical protein N7483_009772 [Penicillium malachiteum]
MPIHWDNKADAKLIAAFSQTGIPDYEAIAKYMGEGVTVSAVKHRLARIREKAGLPSAREARKAGSSAASTRPNSPVLTSKSPAAGRGRKRDRSDPGRAKRNASGGKAGKASHKRSGSDGPIHAKRGMKTDSAANRSDSRFDDAEEDDEDMKEAEEDEEDAFEG